MAALLLSRCVTRGRLSVVSSACLTVKWCVSLGLGELSSPSVVVRLQVLLVCIVWQMSVTLL